MKINSIGIILICSLFIILNGCTSGSQDFNGFTGYLQDPENGLVCEKSAGGISLQVKYVPLEYLVFNETKTMTDSVRLAVKDSIRQTYASSITFLMTIGPAEGESFDITRVGVATYEEFSDRIMDMSFNMGTMAVLKVGDVEISPDIAQMERIYGLRKTREITFVFNAGEININNEDLNFVFTDELFFTGINKFKFKREDINKIPDLKY